MEHKFNIGDRVKVTNTKSKFLGQEGEITDIVYSYFCDTKFFSVLFDGYSDTIYLSEESLELAPPTATYNFEFEYLDNVVVAKFYEYKGEEKTELAKGHGHILHDGVIGIAQAASYASKRCYDKLAGNDETKSYYINK